MKPVIWLVSLAAIGLAFAIAIAGPGTRLGLWEYSTGLTIIQDTAIPLMIASGASVVAFIIACIGARGLAPVALTAAILSGVAAVVPLRMNQLAQSNPVIHDITTDFSNPPPIMAAAKLKRVNPPDYSANEEVPRSTLTLAEVQRAFFPELTPIETDMTMEDAAARSRDAVKSMGMKILSDGQFGDAWIIEAADKSFWFGFVDDFIVRIQNHEDGARIDIRSKSRVGRSDLGANARRVRKFMEKIEPASDG